MGAKHSKAPDPWNDRKEHMDYLSKQSVVKKGYDARDKAEERRVKKEREGRAMAETADFFARRKQEKNRKLQEEKLAAQERVRARSERSQKSRRGGAAKRHTKRRKHHKKKHKKHNTKRHAKRHAKRHTRR